MLSTAHELSQLTCVRKHPIVPTLRIILGEEQDSASCREIRRTLVNIFKTRYRSGRLPQFHVSNHKAGLETRRLPGAAYGICRGECSVGERLTVFARLCVEVLEGAIGSVKHILEKLDFSFISCRFQVRSRLLCAQEEACGREARGMCAHLQP